MWNNNLDTLFYPQTYFKYFISFTTKNTFLFLTMPSWMLKQRTMVYQPYTCLFDSMHQWSYTLTVCKVTRRSILKKELAQFKMKTIDGHDKGRDSIWASGGKIVGGLCWDNIKCWIIRQGEITQKVVAWSFLCQKLKPLSTKAKYVKNL